MQKSPFFLLFLFTSLFGAARFSDFAPLPTLGDVTVTSRSAEQVEVTLHSAALRPTDRFVLLSQAYGPDGTLLHVIQTASAQRAVTHAVDPKNTYTFRFIVQGEEGAARAVSPIEPYDAATPPVPFAALQRDNPLSINTNGFPVIDLTLRTAQTLSAADVAVTENNASQTLVSFAKRSGTAPKVDVAVILDVSESMKEEFSTIRTNMTSFLGTLDAGARLALVTYGSSQTAQNATLALGAKSAFETRFAQLNGSTFTGVTEKAFDALDTVKSLAWRADAQKRVLLFTDENSDDGAVSEAQVTQTLKDRNVTLYGFTKGHAEYARIAAATGGRVFNITSTFNALLTAQTAEYQLLYQTPDRTTPLRTVNVAFKGETAQGVYVMPTAPPITMSLLSRDLITAPQRNGATLTVRASVHQTGGTENVTTTLYYKGDGTNETYNSVTMTQEAPGVFAGEIPGYRVVPNALYFYLEATDQVATARLLDNTDDKPFQITVLPNTPPVIRAASGSSILTTASPEVNKAIAFAAQVTDSTDALAEVYLAYCFADCLNWSNWKRLTGQPTGKTTYTFARSIPAAEVLGSELQYYLRATDNYGAKTFYQGRNINTPFRQTLQGSGGDTPTPTSCKTVGKVSVCAESFTGGAQWTASGKVQLALFEANKIQNKVLRVNGPLTYDGATTLSTSRDTTLVALGIKGNATEPKGHDIELYYGGFLIDTSKAVISLSNNRLFNMFTATLELKKDAVSIALLALKVVGYLQQWGFKLPDTVVLSQTGASSAKFSFKAPGEYTLFFFKVKDPTLEFDPIKAAVGGEWTMTFFSIDINPGLEFLYKPDFGLNALKFGIGKDLLNLPPTTPVYATLDKTTLYLDNMLKSGTTGKPPLAVKGEVGFRLNDRLFILDAVKKVTKKKVLSGQASLKIDTAYTMELAGDVKLFELLKLAHAKIDNAKQGTLSLAAGIDLLGIVKGDLKASFYGGTDKVEMKGAADLKGQIPKSVSYIGGTVIAQQKFDALMRLTTKGVEKCEFSTYQKLLFAKFKFLVSIFQSGGKFRLTVAADGGNVLKYKKTFNLSQAARSLEYSELNQTLHVDAPYDYVLIRVKADADNAAAKLNVTLPDGTAVIGETVDIDREDADIDRVFYRANPSIGEALLAIRAPEVGDYRLTIVNEDHLAGYTLAFLIPNTAPTFTFTAPSGDLLLHGGETVNIAWEDDDPDDDANITFYLDDDRAGNDGLPISDTIAEDDPQNRFDWTVAQTIDTGRYYLYAQIDDGSNVPLYVYSDFVVDVINQNAPATPQNVTVTPQPGSLIVRWDAVEDADLGYRVYVSDDEHNETYPYSFAVGDATEYTIDGLANQHRYRVAVRAVDAAQLHSPFSGGVVAAPNGTGDGGSPDLTLGDISAVSASGHLDGEVTVRVEVKNIGKYAAYSASVRCLYGDVEDPQAMETVQLGTIEPGQHTFATFTFDADSVAALGDKRRYFIYIEDVVLDELDTSNNFGSVEVDLTVREDVNGDFRVDVIDIMRTVAQKDAPIFDAKYDQNGDGIVDDTDVAIVADAWGNR